MSFLYLLFLLSTVCVQAHIMLDSFTLTETSKILQRNDLIESTRASGFHEVVFAVKQRNLDVIERHVVKVSDPKNVEYGVYLSRFEIAELCANPESSEYVLWFAQSLGALHVKSTQYGEYITMRADVKVWEQLFNTEFYFTRFASDLFSKPPYIRAREYSLPSQLVEHVSAVFNTVQLPNRLKLSSPMIRHSVQTGLTITPSVLNSFYNIPNNAGSSQASQAVFQSIDVLFSPDDLTTFQKRFDLPLENISSFIGGGKKSTCKTTKERRYCAEPNLDVQYLMAICQSTPTSYWYYNGDGDVFLEWIIKVGDQDQPPLVNSISYGGSEPDWADSDIKAFNSEAMKLAARGVTILVASGDNGVSSGWARTKDECSYTPDWPSSSPWVTTIGATQGAERGGTEIACASDTNGKITSGGGFGTHSSNSRPSYQDRVVNAYLRKYEGSLIPGFNTTGRAYPDLSLAGLHYEVIIGGEINLVSGTSASTPVVAAMISLLNTHRVNANKPPLGFLNPAIYQYGSQFANDITSGCNNCLIGDGDVCCSEGFCAVKGWDPVTGFGSVDWTKMAKIFLTL